MRLLDFEAGAVALSLVACLSFTQSPSESVQVSETQVQSPAVSASAGLRCEVASWDYVETEGHIRFRVSQTGQSPQAINQMVAINYAIVADTQTYTLTDTFALNLPHDSIFESKLTDQQPWKSVEVLDCEIARESQGLAQQG